MPSNLKRAPSSSAGSCAGSTTASERTSKPAKIPRNVEAARDELARQGMEVTADNLKQALPKKSFDAVTSAFRSAMSPSQRSEYKELKSDKDCGVANPCNSPANAGNLG